jgi:hypothetical protein
MNAIRRTLILALAVLCAPVAHAETIAGSGRPTTESRAASGFRGVALSVPGRVDLVQGATESVSLTADDNVLPLIETVVEDGVLQIRWRDRSRRIDVSTRTPIRVAVKARAIESIAVAGSGDVVASALSTASLKVSLSGSGHVQLAGKAERMDANLSGAGGMKAGDFQIQRGSISISGSGDAVVQARSSLRVSIAGSGDVGYYGDPAVEKSVAGTGAVRRLGAAPG